MGRAPCCDKANVKKGPWSPEEDATLKAYIEQHGTGGNWIALPQKIGLKRCGKSCRLRWLNYLRPNIKHGGFSEEEDNIICSLYVSIGSRWSIIAAQLPGRTDNDIKNYWNTRLKKKLAGGRGKQQQKQEAPEQDMMKTQSSHTYPPNILSMQTQLITPTPTWPCTTSIQQYSHSHLNLNTCTQSPLSTLSNHHHDDMISFQLPHPQHNLFIPTSVINTNLINHPPPAPAQLVSSSTATTDNNTNTNSSSSSSSCHESPNIFEGGFDSFPSDLSELVQFVDVKTEQQVLEDAMLDLEVQDYQRMGMCQCMPSTESTSWGSESDITPHHHHLYSHDPFISQTQPMPQFDFAFHDSAYFGMQ